VADWLWLGEEGAGGELAALLRHRSGVRTEEEPADYRSGNRPDLTSFIILPFLSENAFRRLLTVKYARLLTSNLGIVYIDCYPPRQSEEEARLAATKRASAQEGGEAFPPSLLPSPSPLSLLMSLVHQAPRARETPS
jgi:hypothetical protein